MLSTLAPGIHLTVVTRVVNFTFLEIELPIANYQTLISGCVAERGDSIKNVKVLVVNWGLLFRAMLPTNCLQAAWNLTGDG